MEIFGLNIPTWLAVVIPAVFLLYRYLTKDFDYFKKQGINGPRPYPVVGTILGFFTKGILKYDMELRREYGKVVGCFTGPKPVLMTFDPKFAKELFVKRFSSFQNRQDMEFSDYPMDKMLTILRDDHWKHVRALLTPTFSGSRLRKMTDMIHKGALNLRQALVEICETGESFDIKQLSGNFTMDAIAGTAFGIELDTQKDPNSQFVRMANKAFIRDVKDPRLIVLIVMPKLAKYLGKLGMTFFPRDVTTFFSKVTNDAIKHREDHPEIQAKDFLQLMLTAHIDDPDVKKVLDGQAGDAATDLVEGARGVWSRTKLTHGEILAQALLFFIAGYETTALTISYLAYSLALHQDKQDKLLVEIDSVLGDKDEITYDKCKEMPYLRMCIDETLRMYPAAPRLNREAGEDITIEGIHIRKGMMVSCSIYAMHYDPELWEDPESFIPERFTPEANAARDPYSYLPFGIGPRGCVGMRLALLEVKIAMATILQRYRFVKCDETEIPVKTKSISVSPVNGIKLKLEARK